MLDDKSKSKNVNSVIFWLREGQTNYCAGKANASRMRIFMNLLGIAEFSKVTLI